MAAEIHVGDVGTIFEVTMLDESSGVVDISAAAVLKLTFQKPNGAVVPKTATRSTTGLDGKMRYSTIAGDLDVAGFWKLQGYVEIGAGKWTTDTQEFRVYPNL